MLAQGKAAGRMTFVLFTDKAPRAAENYRLLFSGEKVRLLDPPPPHCPNATITIATP